MLLHVPYPYLFGLLAFFGDLIPYVGAVLAFLPAFLVGVLTNGWVNALLVTVAFVAIFEAEGHLLAPNSRRPPGEVSARSSCSSRF